MLKKNSVMYSSNKWNLIFCFSFLLLGLNGTAQPLPSLKMPFQVNNKQLKNPLVGGFNVPQFSEVDLNNDGIMDLFVFDRFGNVVSTFINGGISGQVDYTYSPGFAENFPDMQEWALLRDYDNDGVMDIFTASNIPGIDGIVVYRGFIEDGRINFEQLNFYDLDSNIIPAMASGGFTNLYVSGEDVPAIDDVDGDGDLDVFSFGVNGGYIFYYKNRSVEMGFGTDSLKFDLATTCLGGVYESGLVSCLCLPEEMGACCDGFTSNVADTRHAGSTLVTFDNDGDGDKDLILGDLSFDNMVMLVNTGDSDNIFYGSQDCSFPDYNVPVDVPVFPAGYYLDVNNDGKKDFLASPNANANGEDYFCVWYYENLGTTENPTFDFQQRDLFVDEMLDLGTVANPTFVDYNQDGLLDLVVGNETFYNDLSDEASQLFLYENIGTASSPAFKLVNDDYLELNQYGSSFYDLAPAFGDLDSDGDLDALVGGHSGELFYFENIAGPGNTFEFDNLQPIYKGIDVGKHAKPQIVDLNRDGLMDLVIGEANGNVNYLPNIGTPTSPDFETDHEVAPNKSNLGGIDVRVLGDVTGYSTPVFLDLDGEFIFFSGSEKGNIIYYTDIEGNLDGNFTKAPEYYGDNVKVGARITLAIADLNNDNVLDMVVGNFRGGINAYYTNITTEGTVSVDDPNEPAAFILYPNPVNSLLTIEMINEQIVPVTVNIYNSIGQLVEQQTTTNRQLSINTNRFAKGVYICELRMDESISVQKFIVR